MGCGHSGAIATVDKLPALHLDPAKVREISGMHYYDLSREECKLPPKVLRRFEQFVLDSISSAADRPRHEPERVGTKRGLLQPQNTFVLRPGVGDTAVTASKRTLQNTGSINPACEVNKIQVK